MEAGRQAGIDKKKTNECEHMITPLELMCSHHHR